MRLMAGMLRRVCSCSHTTLNSQPQATALIYCYGFGKVLASRSDMEAFMNKPEPCTEKPMMFFEPSAATKLVGIEFKEGHNLPLILC